jgi:hypothetical protein
LFSLLLQLALLLALLPQLLCRSQQVTTAWLHWVSRILWPLLFSLAIRNLRVQVAVCGRSSSIARHCWQAARRPQ